MGDQAKRRSTGGSLIAYRAIRPQSEQGGWIRQSVAEVHDLEQVVRPHRRSQAPNFRKVGGCSSSAMNPTAPCSARPPWRGRASAAGAGSPLGCGLPRRGEPQPCAVRAGVSHSCKRKDSNVRVVGAISRTQVSRGGKPAPCPPPLIVALAATRCAVLKAGMLPAF
jgi:hypothetical protein